MAASCTYHLPSSPSCSTRAIQKSLTLNKKYLSFLEKSQEKNVKTERTRGLGKKKKKEREREELGKGESNDSPEIPDRRVTSDIPGLPSGDTVLVINQKQKNSFSDK